MQSSDCQLIGNLKFPNIGSQKMVQLESLRGSLLIQMESGELYSMEVNNLEQVLLNPYIEQIKPTVQRFQRSSTVKFSKDHPFITIRKNTAEQNDQKGSVA